MPEPEKTTSTLYCFNQHEQPVSTRELWQQRSRARVAAQPRTPTDPHGKHGMRLERLKMSEHALGPSNPVGLGSRALQVPSIHVRQRDPGLQPSERITRPQHVAHQATLHPPTASKVGGFGAAFPQRRRKTYSAQPVPIKPERRAVFRVLTLWNPSCVTNASISSGLADS